MKKYNGFSNYFTWLIHLWLTQDKQFYLEVTTLIQMKPDFNQYDLENYIDNLFTKLFNKIQYDNQYSSYDSIYNFIDNLLTDFMSCAHINYDEILTSLKQRMLEKKEINYA